MEREELDDLKRDALGTFRRNLLTTYYLEAKENPTQSDKLIFSELQGLLHNKKAVKKILLNFSKKHFALFA